MVIPRSIEDIVTTLDICREHGVPILPRGGGTSQNGQCVNVAVVIDKAGRTRTPLYFDCAAAKLVNTARGERREGGARDTSITSSAAASND